MMVLQRQCLGCCKFNWQARTRIERALIAAWCIMTAAVLVCVAWLIPSVIDLDGEKFQDGMSVIAGLFLLLAVPLSFFQTWQHCHRYTKADYQRRILRIVWMVPVYGICSWASVVRPGVAPYMEALKELYEAYLIYNFYRLLGLYLESVAVSRGAASLSSYLQSTRPGGVAPAASEWLVTEVYRDAEDREASQVASACSAKHPFLQACTMTVTAYVLWRPISAGLSLVGSILGIYDQDTLAPDNMYVWLLAADGIFLSAATYCLEWVFREMGEELQGLEPFLKIECLRAFQLYTFWQEVVIAVLVMTGIVTPGKLRSDYALTAILNNLLICGEMWPLAIAHAFAFPAVQVDEYAGPPPEDPPGVLKALLDALHAGDVVAEACRYTQERILPAIRRKLTSRGHSSSGRHQAAGHAEDRLPLVPEDTAADNVH